jgi:hypothetical protein
MRTRLSMFPMVFPELLRGSPPSMIIYMRMVGNVAFALLFIVFGF